jgi:hypothetical protein
MADQWYFSSDAKRVGPFSAAELKELGARGRIRPSDTVWKEGIAQGVLASKVKNLFPAVVAEALPEKANSAGIKDAAAPTTPSARLSSSLPNEAPPSLEPGLPSKDDHVPDDDQPQQIIADGLKLKEIEEDNLPIAGAAGPADSGSRGNGAADESSPDNANAAPGQPHPQKQPKKKGRAIGAKGAVIVRQDGQVVQFRKKCLKCGYEDASKATMPIRNGITRGTFFCPKCRKAGAFAIQCTT